jgi:hypothetical protein
VTARARRVAALGVALVFSRGTPLAAQRRPALDIRLPTQVTAEGPVVSARDMLSGARIREPLAAGFPARFHFTIELWSESALLDKLERRAEYYVIVRHIALDDMYEVTRVEEDRAQSLGKFKLVDDAERQVGKAVRVGISAPHSTRKMYYQAALAVQILSLSDLDEIDRWLKGELRPAISGERSPGAVVSRGLKAFVARLLGGETREYEMRTATFVPQ